MSFNICLIVRTSLKYRQSVVKLQCSGYKLTLGINASFPIIKARIKDKSKIGAKENIHQPTEEKEHKYSRLFFKQKNYKNQKSNICEDFITQYVQK